MHRSPLARLRSGTRRQKLVFQVTFVLLGCTLAFSLFTSWQDSLRAGLGAATAVVLAETLEAGLSRRRARRARNLSSPS